MPVSKADAGDSNSNEQGGSHFVLVHGASHGGWCWYKVGSFLQGCGHKVTCIDLKSAGIDPTSPDTLFKFEDYNQPLLAFLSSLPPHEKVILVGHSARGNVTQALHRFPTKMQAVVYLAAAMVKNGTASLPAIATSQPNCPKVAAIKFMLKLACSFTWRTTFSFRRRNRHQKPCQKVVPLTRVTLTLDRLSPDMFDCTYGLGPDAPPTSMIMKKELQREYYYSMSPLEDCTLAGMLLRPTPFRAHLDAKFPEGEGSEKVPRVFIRTLHDNVMCQESQDNMIKGWPPSEVLALDSDHSAFFSIPVELFGLLLQIASKYA